jgi:iron(III) transport system substrate-binding protein
MRDPDRWRGRIAVLDIETNGLGFLAMLQWSLCEPEFDAFLDALRSSAARIAGTVPALVGALTESADLALHVLRAYASEAVAADPHLYIAPSAAPPLAVSRIAFIPRRAANPEAASLFLAYMLSRPGQEALTEGGLIPITSRADFTTIPLDEKFARFIDSGTRKALLARWRGAVGRPDVNAGGSMS